MSSILVAIELRDLLDRDILCGHSVEWLRPESPVLTTDVPELPRAGGEILLPPA